MKRAILALACGIGLFVLGAPASAGPLQETMGKPIHHACGNASGSFRTTGRYASATVLHRHFVISAGHTYFGPS